MRRSACASTKSCFRVRLRLSKPVSISRSPSSSGNLPTLASSVAVGALPIAAHLRYQACDINLCYPPSTADLQWTVAVVPASQTTDGRGDEIFQQIAFGHGESPSAAPSPALAATPALAEDTGVATLDDFTVLGTTGYSTSAEFVTFIHNAERGVKERGMFEGRGPLAILLIVLIGGFALNLTPCVLPMIPINLAIIGAGAQASSRGRGFLVQELPRDGSDDVGECRRQVGSGRLREDQVSSRTARCVASEGCDEAFWRRRPADVRHPPTDRRSLIQP